LRGALKPLAGIEFTASELEQEVRLGHPRILFEKGGRITVYDVNIARAALKKAEEKI
jgi:hypothetical protein